MKNIYRKIAVSSLVFFPLITFADVNSGKTLKDIAALIVQYLNIGLAMIVALAVIVFVWNVFQYFFTEKDKTEAGMYVLYSVIGFFVIFSFWGMIAILRNTLNLDNNQPGAVPTSFNVNNNGLPQKNTLDPAFNRPN